MHDVDQACQTHYINWAIYIKLFTKRAKLYYVYCVTLLGSTQSVINLLQ